LLADTWSKAATIDNPFTSFRATGIFSYNSEAILEHAYSVSDAAKSFIGIAPQRPHPQKFSNVVTLPMAEHLPNARPTTPEPQPGPSLAPDLPLSGGKILNTISPLPIEKSKNYLILF
ncbi:hypothetical protein HHI36_017225, partial [Cryptolaemus montrouzieri]